MPYAVRVTSVSERHLAVVRFRATAAEIPERIGAAFSTVVSHLLRTGTATTGAAVACYAGGDDRFDVAASFEVESPIEEAGEAVPYELPAGDVATVTHVGRYEALPRAYEALRASVEAQGCELDDASPMWEEYRSPPETPPEEVTTVVSQPLKR